jgi:NTE family protein
MKNGLILSGGGAKAAYEAGVVQALSSLGLSFDVVTGTSAGAFNAAFVAANQQPQLLDLWRNITASDIYRLRVPLWLTVLIPTGLIYWIVNFKKGIYDNKPFRKFLEKTIDVFRIVGSQIHLIIIADDLVSRKKVAFTNKPLIRGNSSKSLAIPLTTENLIEALLASTPIPGLFPPVLMNQHQLVDGGLTHNAPIGAAIDAGADRLYCILTSPARPGLSQVLTLPDIINTSLDMMITAKMEADILEARLKNLVTGKKHVDISVIRPLESLPLDTLEFDPGKIEDAIKTGLKAPILKSISPSELRPGSLVKLDGRNFESPKGKVFLSDREIEITGWTENEITIKLSEDIKSNFNLLTIRTSVGTVETNLRFNHGKSNSFIE